MDFESADCVNQPEEKQQMNKLNNNKEYNKKVKKKLTVRGVLTFLVVLSMVRQFFLGNYEGIFTGLLCLMLFAVPIIIDRKLHVDIPKTLESIILLMIFSAEMLGEVDAFYVKIKGWDTILHTTNGFLMAAVGIALVDILNRSDKFAINLSPFFVAFVAFCFSMTVGVTWEFFEFSMDLLLKTDMQKDWVIPAIHSVMLDPTNTNRVISIPIETLEVNGIDLKLGGYLDVGIVDTMKDLLVNLVGAVIFSIIGYFYVKGGGEGRFVSRFIPRLRTRK